MFFPNLNIRLQISRSSIVNPNSQTHPGWQSLWLSNCSFYTFYVKWVLKFIIIVIPISRYICVSNVRLGGVYVSFKHKEWALVVLADVINNKTRLHGKIYIPTEVWGHTEVTNYHIRSLLFLCLRTTFYTEKRKALRSAWLWNTLTRLLTAYVHVNEEESKYFTYLC